MNEEDLMREEEIDTLDKFVTFQSGDECFGIQIKLVNEIIAYQEITAMPESREYIRGIINLRGKIITAIDARLRFGQEPLEYDARTCIIILTVGSLEVGLIVEKIAEIVEIPKEEIVSAADFGKISRRHNHYIYGIGKIGKSVKLLLNPDKLLDEDDLKLLGGVDETEFADDEEQIDTSEIEAETVENEPERRKKTAGKSKSKEAEKQQKKGKEAAVKPSKGKKTEGRQAKKKEAEESKGSEIWEQKSDWTEEEVIRSMLEEAQTQRNDGEDTGNGQDEEIHIEL